MALYIKTCFCLISICLLTLSNTRQKVRISLNVQAEKGQKAELFVTNMVNSEGTLLSTAKLDSTGNGVIEIDLDHNTFAYLKLNEAHIYLFLTPGDQIKLSTNASDKKHGLKYSGDGEELYHYLSRQNEIARKYENLDGKHPIHLDLEPFLKRRDALQNDYDKSLDSLKAKVKIPKETQYLLSQANKMRMIFFHQNWSLSHYGMVSNDPKIPKEISAVINNIPLDTVALRASVPYYDIVMNIYFHSQILAPAYKQIPEQYRDSLLSSIPSIVNTKLKATRYPRLIEQFLLTQNILYNLNSNGITPTLNAVYSNYKNESTEPQYLATIKKNYDEWLKLEPGQPAPDFAGTTPDGKKLSLNDLKGKIVYVDVWATWCGPCKEEFPFSIKLEKHFTGNDQVVFLFVSTDQNLGTWRKMLVNETTPKGLHINQQQDDQPDAIMKNYRIWGIPRYIIIDQNGKIVRANAPRPSSDKAQELIAQLIASFDRNGAK